MEIPSNFRPGRGRGRARDFGPRRKPEDSIICPICQKSLRKHKINQANEHIERCLLNPPTALIQAPIFPPNPQFLFPYSTVPQPNFRPSPLIPNSSPSIISPKLNQDLNSLKVNWDEGYVKFHIARNELLIDSTHQLLSLNTRQLRSEFQVQFVGESSHDAGGMVKEWFNLFAKEILTSGLQLFRPTNTEEKRFRIADCNNIPEFYRAAGRLLGKAILSGIPVNFPLSIAVLKQILNLPVDKEDLKFLDAEFFAGIKSMEQNPVEGVFYETFSITDGPHIIDLIPDGRNIDVTDSNKNLFIQLRTDYELNTSINHSLTHLKIGVFDVIPEQVFQGLTYQDLDFLICGKSFIDLDEWRNFTVYKGEFKANHSTIKLFWDCLGQMSQEDLAKLLVFVTGTGRVPVEGFGQLKTQRGEPALFTIESFVYFNGAMPRAHTCFNRLDLPVYRNKKELWSGLQGVLKNYDTEFHLD